MLREGNFWGRKTSYILLLALIFVFFTSCSNIEIFQNGRLVVAVSGSRSASESTIFTVTIVDAAGSAQSQIVAPGEIAQFDDLVAGSYSINVEGKESDISTMFGSAEVSVVVGEVATATVSLSTVAHSLETLQLLLTKGGTVYIGSDIRLDSGLEVIENEVYLVALKDVVLTNNADAPILTVQNSKITLGGGDYTLTLDGNDKGEYGVSVTDGELILKQNTVIKNCSNSGVYISNASFTMTGGTIRENAAPSGGGVYLLHGTFVMNDGLISENELSNTGTSYGGGIYIENGDFTMNGGSITNNTKGIKRGGAIAVKETALFTMNAGTISGNSASSDGGGIYLFGDTNKDRAICILNGGTITNNNCNSNGGGISTWGICTVNAGAVITGNTCSRGGDIYAYLDDAYVNNGGTVGDVVIQQ